MVTYVGNGRQDIKYSHNYFIMASNSYNVGGVCALVILYAEMIVTW